MQDGTLARRGAYWRDVVPLPVRTGWIHLIDIRSRWFDCVGYKELGFTFISWLAGWKLEIRFGGVVKVGMIDLVII